MHIVSVRLTEAAHRQLTTEAPTYCKSMGGMLRAVWTGTPEAVRPPRSRTVEEVAQLRQLGGLANNLNQLTKQLNAGAAVQQGARQVLVQLHRLLNELAPDPAR